MLTSYSHLYSFSTIYSNVITSILIFIAKTGRQSPQSPRELKSFKSRSITRMTDICIAGIDYEMSEGVEKIISALMVVTAITRYSHDVRKIITMVVQQGEDDSEHSSGDEYSTCSSESSGSRKNSDGDASDSDSDDGYVRVGRESPPIREVVTICSLRLRITGDDDDSEGGSGCGIQISCESAVSFPATSNAVSDLDRVEGTSTVYSPSSHKPTVGLLNDPSNGRGPAGGAAATLVLLCVPGEVTCRKAGDLRCVLFTVLADAGLPSQLPSLPYSPYSTHVVTAHVGFGRLLFSVVSLPPVSATSTTPPTTTASVVNRGLRSAISAAIGVSNITPSKLPNSSTKSHDVTVTSTLPTITLKSLRIYIVPLLYSASGSIATNLYKQINYESSSSSSTVCITPSSSSIRGISQSAGLLLSPGEGCLLRHSSLVSGDPSRGQGRTRRRPSDRTAQAGGWVGVGIWVSDG